MDGESALIVDPELLFAPDSVEDESVDLVDYDKRGIVLDSDDEQVQVGGRDRLNCVTNGELNNSCLKIRRPQREGYLWRNSQRVSRQSACPPNEGACKIQFSCTDNKVAQAENESMIGSGRQVINQVYSRKKQRKGLSSHMEEIEMKNVVKEVITSDESACYTFQSTNPETTERGKHSPLVTSVHEPVRLSYIDSQEAEEILLSEPLSFVDHYLSLNTFNLCDSEQDPARKSKQIVCLPTLNTNGLQSLARRVNDKRAEESGTFDWDAQPQNKEESFPVEEGCQLRCKFESTTTNQDTAGSNYPKCLDVLTHENIPGHAVSVVRRGLTGDSDSVKVQLAPELNNNVNCAMEVVEHVKIISPDASLGEDEKDYDLEDFSTGVEFDTQVAVEAMEALLHAPPDSNACNTQNIPSGIIDQSSEDTEIFKKIGNSTSTGTGQHIKSKRSAKQLYENNGCRSGEYEQYLRGHCRSASKKKLKENGSSFCTTLVDEEIQVRRKSLRNKACQRKRSPENIQGHTSPKSLRSNLRGLFEGNTQISFIIPKRRRSQLLQCSLQHFSSPAKQSKDTSEYGMEFNFSKKGSKTNDSVTDVKEECKSKENGPKLASHASLGEADFRREIKLECWRYPKKKRTRVSFLRRSDEPKQQGPMKIFYEKPKLSENPNSVPRLAGNIIVYTRRLKYDSVNKDPWAIVKHVTNEKSSYVHTSESPQVNGCNVVANPGKENCLEQTSDNVINTVHNTESMKIDKECKRTSSGLNICNKSTERKSKQKQKSISPMIRELRLLGSKKSQPDLKPTDSRRLNSSAYVSVLFSQNLSHKTLRQLKKILARLGFSEVSCSSAATHFIADRFVRTKNMLEGIALGKLVVTSSWLESCGQAGYSIAEKSYILRDARKEKELCFSMPVSLARAIQHPLLLGRRVLITPNVKPNKDLIQTLVKAVCGQEVEDFELAETKYGTVSPDLLIISCEEDYGHCEPFLERGVAIYSSELLLNGIITQKLQHERYRILINYVKGNHARYGKPEMPLSDNSQ